MKNPLKKRVFRELKADWRKYLVIFLFLSFVIGLVSGMYVANGSMLYTADQAKTKYKMEWGHFELEKEADAATIAAIETGDKADVKTYFMEKAEEEAGEYWDMVKEDTEAEIDKKIEAFDLDDEDFTVNPITVVENFYRNEEEDYNNDGDVDDENDGTIRVYAQNDDVNLADFLSGRAPENENEIAIDRKHADTVGLEVGDTIKISGEEFEIVGLLAYVNYQSLHEKNSDMIFDTQKFDVGMVTDEGFNRLHKSVHYAYAWFYENEPADENEEKAMSDDLVLAIASQAAVSDNELTDFLPRYANAAINFAADDMAGDVSMAGMILNVLTVVLAFIFAITTLNTITKESSVIGTLRASGYTKGELLRHYIAMPVVVTIIGGIIGNILGYTCFKELMIDSYYNSYSLPNYETTWSAEALIRTTLIPVALMFIINLVTISRMLSNSPLRFLRHDLKRTKRKKTVRLPRWSFFKRFRLRIIFQNKSNYFVLFLGILFVELMLALAVGMPDTLKYYQKNAKDMMFARYQYVIKDYQDEDGKTVSTSNKEAEKYSVTNLIFKGKNDFDEPVTVYGVMKDSDYVEIANLADLKEGEVYISDSFAEKYGLKVGETFSLNEEFEDTSYEFTVKGTYDGTISVAIFMPNAVFNDVFDKEDGSFCGFFSNEELTDLDEENIATVITEREITKMADQLDRSMGFIMYAFKILCIFLAAIMIYLLSKIIIEKNENAISMTKILGYTNKEISSLYLLSTTIVLVIEDILCVFISSYLMSLVWREFMYEYSGWMLFELNPLSYVKMFVFVFVAYLIVVYFDFKRIKNIPMDEALKNVE